MRYVIAPGYLDSDEGHWQTLWQAGLGPDAVRTAPGSWTEPAFDDWVAALDAVMTPGAVIVAHSLGCLTALAWLERHPGGAAGAFLVAVPDPEGATFPPEITGFTRPTVPASVPVLMVASTDDPYAGIGFSRDTAALLGADLVEVERGGHLSTASGRGPWPEGRALLDRFVAGL
ncbi:MAG: alpha/beta hydrolase [Actinobacteria bacterium]|nr:alpha/beta hydrolase [Actinomycetota bacterium]